MQRFRIYTACLVLVSLASLFIIASSTDPASAGKTEKVIFFLSVNLTLVGLGALVSSLIRGQYGQRELRRGILLALAVDILSGAARVRHLNWIIWVSVLGAIGLFEFIAARKKIPPVEDYT